MGKITKREWKKGHSKPEEIEYMDEESDGEPQHYKVRSNDGSIQIMSAEKFNQKYKPQAEPKSAAK